MRSRRAVPAGQARRASRTCFATSAGAVGSDAKGGGLLAGRETSERVASVTPTAMPAAAAAAAPTTSHTRSRGLIGERRYPRAPGYISESDADVQGIAATGADRDLRGRRLPRTRADRRRR